MDHSRPICLSLFCTALILSLVGGAAPLHAACPERRQSSPQAPGRTADEQYLFARSLAVEGRRLEAAAAFRAGEQAFPDDPRFPTELAGLAFLDERYAESKKHLSRALRLAPDDPYLIDFLATVYLLEENLEAALSYWNRIDKPRIRRVQTEISPRTDAVLVDRAFALSPASTLRLPELELTRARLNSLDIYSQTRFDLLAREDQAFDLHFQALDRPAWRESKLGASLSMLRGLAYQTVHPEFFNVGGRALNVRSLARWDPKKRRVNISVAWPVGRDPAQRIELFLDARDEQWLFGAPPETGAGPGLRLQKAEAGAEFSSIVNARLSWTAGLSIAARSFVGQTASGAASSSREPGLFHEGLSAGSLFRLDLAVLRDYERRVTIDASAEWRLGRLLNIEDGRYSRWQQKATLRWFPLDTGDDYAVEASWRSGQTFGSAPFDELYGLGMDRDTDLWLRGHRATADGYKGAALLGDRYLLVNSELDKTIYRHPLLKLTAGPFVDGGAIDDSTNLFGSSGWRWDGGLQCKVKAAGGFTVAFSYGRNLQSGSDAFYWRVLHD